MAARKINDLDDVFVLVFVYLCCSSITSFLDINLLSFGMGRIVMYGTETLGRVPEKGEEVGKIEGRLDDSELGGPSWSPCQVPARRPALTLGHSYHANVGCYRCYLSVYGHTM